jgi:hypothetical protein
MEGTADIQDSHSYLPAQFVQLKPKKGKRRWARNSRRATKDISIPFSKEPGDIKQGVI